MIHYKASYKDGFYGVSHNGDNLILVQLQECDHVDNLPDQVRIGLTPDEARHMIKLLEKSIRYVEQTKTERLVEKWSPIFNEQLELPFPAIMLESQARQLIQDTNDPI